MRTESRKGVDHLVIRDVLHRLGDLLADQVETFSGGVVILVFARLGVRSQHDVLMNSRNRQDAFSLGGRDRIDHVLHEFPVEVVQDVVFPFSGLHMIRRFSQHARDVVAVRTRTVDQDPAFDLTVDQETVILLFQFLYFIVKFQLTAVFHRFFHGGDAHLERCDDPCRRKGQDFCNAVGQVGFFLSGFFAVQYLVGNFPFFALGDQSFQDLLFFRTDSRNKSTDRLVGDLQFPAEIRIHPVSAQIVVALQRSRFWVMTRMDHGTVGACRAFRHITLLFQDQNVEIVLAQTVSDQGAGNAGTDYRNIIHQLYYKTITRSSAQQKHRKIAKTDAWRKGDPLFSRDQDRDQSKYGSQQQRLYPRFQASVHG